MLRIIIYVGIKKDLWVNLEIIGFVILIVYVSNILYIICVYV